MARVLAFGDCAPVVELLRDRGDEILRAPGKSRALGLARDLLPDLVLVGGTVEAAALEIVAALTADSVTGLLPILLVVGRDEPGRLERGLTAGAHDVLLREADRGELLARVEAALRHKTVVERLIAAKQRVTLLELAGAVAHKINQPLTSMSIIVETLHASHARGDLSSDRLEAKLAELQRLVDRMAAIVKQVAGVIDYRTVDYLGTVKIIDLDRDGKA